MAAARGIRVVEVVDAHPILWLVASYFAFVDAIALILKVIP